MSATDNKALVRRGYGELFGGNLDIADEVIAADYVCHHGTGMEICGPEGIKELMRSNLNAFPDARWVIEDMVAEGDKVVTRFSMSGTHKGELRGIPPSGETVTAWFISIDRIAGGKLAESWQRYDTLSFMRQLGAVPPAG